MTDRNEELSTQEIIRQISEMKREKYRAEDQVRKLEATQKRIAADDEIRRKEALDSVQRFRSRSRSGKKDEDKKEDGEEKKDDKDGDGKEKKKELRTAGRGGKADGRSRNLFGSMLGHLKAAKKDVIAEAGTKAAELRKKAEEKSALKVVDDKSRAQETRAESIKERQEEERAKATKLEKDIAEKELLLLHRNLEKHYATMMNFIRTNAEPTIFFLPAKHNKETESKLKDTGKAIKHKISSLKVQITLPEKKEVTPEEKARAAAAASALDAAVNGGAAKEPLPEEKDRSDDEASNPDAEKAKNDSKSGDEAKNVSKSGDEGKKSGDEADKKDAASEKSGDKKRKSDDDAKSDGSNKSKKSKSGSED